MRIFQKDIVNQSGQVFLEGDALKHLRARRVRISDQIELFDGFGHVCIVSVSEIKKNQAVCGVLQETLSSTEDVDDVCLVLGMPKFSTVEYVLQKSVELGVSEIILLQSDYSPLSIKPQDQSKKLDRWEKIVIGACEQSGRVYVPRLSYMSFDEYLSSDRQGRTQYFFHPHAQKRVGQEAMEMPCDLLVGPEGGWSDAEVVHAEKMSALSIPGFILRTDTACIAAILSTKMQDQQ